jgi:hypothetical protein
MWVCDPPVRSCLNLLSASPGVFQPGSGRRRSSLPAIGPPPVRESASIVRRPTARTECPRRPPLHRFSTFLRFSRRSGLASGSECQGCGRRARRELYPLAVYEPDRAHLLHVRHCTKITRGPGSRDAGKAARDRTRLPSFAFKFTPFDTVLTANNIKSSGRPSEHRGRMRSQNAWSAPSAANCSIDSRSSTSGMPKARLASTSSITTTTGRTLGQAAPPTAVTPAHQIRDQQTSADKPGSAGSSPSTGAWDALAVLVHITVPVSR